MRKSQKMPLLMILTFFNALEGIGSEVIRFFQIPCMTRLLFPFFPCGATVEAKHVDVHVCKRLFQNRRLSLPYVALAASPVLASPSAAVLLRSF